MTTETNIKQDGGQGVGGHTPGDWRAISWRDPPAAGRTTVAVRDDSGQGFHVVGVFEKERDAILAAASKDLLRELIHAKATLAQAFGLDVSECVGGVFVSINAAIAKATGETA